MKLPALIAAVLLFISCTSQAQLLHEYDYVNNAPLQVVKIENDGPKYVAVKLDNSAISIYNTDHTLWKSIPLSLPATLSAVVTASYCSKHLFNSDNNIEILLTYNELVGTNIVYTTLLLNEIGNTLYTLKNIFSVQVKEIEGTWKLIASYMPTNGKYYSSVYSLPGQWTGASNILPTGGNGNTEIYPNPLAFFSTLAYILPNNSKSGSIQVFNNIGQMVKSYLLSTNAGDILLNKGDYLPGQYIYKVIADNEAVMTNSFIVN